MREMVSKLFNSCRALSAIKPIDFIAIRKEDADLSAVVRLRPRARYTRPYPQRVRPCVQSTRARCASDKGPTTDNPSPVKVIPSSKLRKYLILLGFCAFAYFP